MTRTENDILDKAVSGRRLVADEGLALLESHNLAALGRAADAVCRRLHREPYRTYNIDRNINYTNVCTSGCRFCAFSRKAGEPDAYVIARDELFRKIQETLDLGGDQILLQGGMHPEPYRTYNIDRNINYTNVCIGGCRFCAFSRRPGDPDGYVLGREPSGSLPGRHRRAHPRVQSIGGQGVGVGMGPRRGAASSPARDALRCAGSTSARDG